MIWTNNMYHLVSKVVQDVRKNLQNPCDTNCVMKTACRSMTLQECQEIAKYFQLRGFEATWYQKDNKRPVVMVTWGLPFDIDEIDNVYKSAIEDIDDDNDEIVKLMAQYIHEVYVRAHKNICVIPFEHLSYIYGDGNNVLPCDIYFDALQEAVERYALKIRTDILDRKYWHEEYIFIRKQNTV